MSHRPRETIWSALRIAVKPTALAEVAGRLSPRSAFFAGVLGATAGTFLAPSAFFGAGGEPFPGIQDYILHTVILAPFIYAFFVMPFWAILLGTDLFGSTVQPSGRARYLWKVCVLTPTTVALPLLVWSVGAALTIFSQPSMGYYGSAGRPAWLDSPMIDLWSSLAWPMALLFVALGFAIHAARRFGEFPEDGEYPECAFCQYNLTGNVSGVCPECGTTVFAENEKHES